MSELVHFLLMWFVGFDFMLGNLAVDAVVHFAVSGSAAGFCAFDDLCLTTVTTGYYRTWEGERNWNE